MNNIHERLKLLRKTLGRSQVEFAHILHRTQTAISEYESGKKNLTDRTIADICREFNVNEQWLRTGEGQMFKEQSDIDNQLAAEVAKLIRSEDEFTKKLIHAYLSLPDDAKDKVKDFVTALMKDK